MSEQQLYLAVGLPPIRSRQSSTYSSAKSWSLLTVWFAWKNVWSI